MQHGVTVRTYRDQVLDRIYLVVLLDLRQRLKVVDMNKAGTPSTVSLFKIKSARCAGQSMVLDACLSSVPIALVSVDQNLDYRSFLKRLVL
jgi:hypothetical protein